MGIQGSQNLTPTVPAKISTGVKPHTSKTSHPSSQNDTNKLANLPQQDQFIQQQVNQSLGNALAEAGNPKLSIQLASDAGSQIASEIGTSCLQGENKKTGKSDSRKAPPKPGSLTSASALVGNLLLKSLDLAHQAGLPLVAGVLEKGQRESKGLLSGKDQRMFLDATSANPQAHRMGLQNYFSSEVAQKLVELFSGNPNIDQDEVLLAADIVQTFMSGATV